MWLRLQTTLHPANEFERSAPHHDDDITIHRQLKRDSSFALFMQIKMSGRIPGDQNKPKANAISGRFITIVFCVTNLRQRHEHLFTAKFKCRSNGPCTVVQRSTCCYRRDRKKSVLELEKLKKRSRKTLKGNDVIFKKKGAGCLLFCRRHLNDCGRGHTRPIGIAIGNSCERRKWRRSRE